jgi:hypothetical protein
VSQRALRLQLVPDEPDQALRLARFRQEHPGVIIGKGGFGTWQAARDPLSLTMGESYAPGTGQMAVPPMPWLTPMTPARVLTMAL